MRKLNSKPDQLFWQFAKISIAWTAPTDLLVSSAAFSCKTLCLSGVARASITNWKANVDENNKNMRTQAFQECFNWITGNVAEVTCDGKLSQLTKFCRVICQFSYNPVYPLSHQSSGKIRLPLQVNVHSCKFPDDCGGTLLCKSRAKVGFSAPQSLRPDRSLVVMQLWSRKLSWKATFKRFPSIFPSPTR